MSAPRRADKPTIATAPRGAVPAAPARKPAAAPAPSVPARGAKPAPQRPEPKAESGASRRIDNLKKSYHDTVAELKKVNWPDRETTRNLTIVVIALSIVLGIFLGGLDFVLQRIFEAVA